MAEYPDTPEDLYPFARALVLKLVKDKGLKWDEHRIEDAIQDLFLAGWQVWMDEQDIGLAKNRMASRKHNLLRDDASERRHEPKAESQRFETSPVGDDGSLWDEDKVRGWDEPSERDVLRGDPAEEAAMREFLDRLPDRRREILMHRMAGYTNEEIADLLGISKRTVEREMANIRKEHGNDEG